ncbi:MAG: peptidylprolyl isomerase [Polyangiaceae bacterium]|nr:peptidylprolyl isomerase [Polyangiaceae bacterium]
MELSSRVALGALLFAAVGAVVLGTRQGAVSAPAAPPAPPSASASASAEPDAPGDAGLDGEVEAEEAETTLGATADGGSLPAGAPKSVRFGVILVTYEGAQLAPRGARSKQAARALATELATEAQTQFAKAVERGDRGSLADAGRIPRGILEPHIEFALFTLKKGEVAAEPVDTPRGFWVVRRLE